MQSFSELSDKTKKKVGKLAWPKGAILYCGTCPRRSEKTPEQMEKFLSSWPKCPQCGTPAQVKPL